MESYFKQIDIKWADLDANMHVSSMAYVALIDHAKMSFFNENGFPQDMFAKLRIGPVVFNQQLYFLKEILPATTVHVNVELLGRSEDYRFVQFCHSIYNHEGHRAMYASLTVSWMDHDMRKLIETLPKALIEVLDKMPKSEHFKILTKSDIQLPSLSGVDTISVPDK